MKKKVLSALLVASMVATMFTGCGDKKEAPTLFQINGQLGYQSWKDYWLDFKDSKVYGELTNDDFAVKSGGGVYGVAYVYEGYGIVVNKKLLEQAGHKLVPLLIR